MKRLLEGTGTVLVLALFGLTTAFLVNACTGQQIKEGIGLTKTGSVLLPSPAGPLVEVAASALDDAFMAVVKQHPELLEEKWGTKDWVLLGSMFVAGATRRKILAATKAVVSHKLPIPQA